MTDTNQAVQDANTDTATPVASTEAATEETKTVDQNGAATEAKVEETKAE